MGKVKRWSNSDNRFLIKYLDEKSKSEIADQLGRSEKAVRTQMSKLGLLTKANRQPRLSKVEKKEVQKKENVTSIVPTIQQVVELAVKSKMSYGEYVSSYLN